MAKKRVKRRPPPEGVDTRSSETGLRTVAVFEAIKGVVVLALGLGALAFLHRDLERAAQSLLVHLHVNPDHRLAHAFLNAASRTTDAGLWAIAGACLAYALVRFVEAYGLWHRRVWAEWFALLSGTLYLPWEIYNIVEHPGWLHYAAFSINLTIILYMLYIRVEACKSIFCDEEEEAPA